MQWCGLSQWLLWVYIVIYIYIHIQYSLYRIGHRIYLFNFVHNLFFSSEMLESKPKTHIPMFKIEPHILSLEITRTQRLPRSWGQRLPNLYAGSFWMAVGMFPGQRLVVGSAWCSAPVPTIPRCSQQSTGTSHVCALFLRFPSCVFFVALLSHSLNISISWNLQDKSVRNLTGTARGHRIPEPGHCHESASACLWVPRARDAPGRRGTVWICHECCMGFMTPK